MTTHAFRPGYTHPAQPVADGPYNQNAVDEALAAWRVKQAATEELLKK